MNRLRAVVLILVGLAAIPGVTQAQDFRQRYVGKAICAPELKSEYSDLSMRLDKKQGLELYQRRWKKVHTVLIVQNGQNSCGTIKDVVQTTPNLKHKHFEFRCFDAQSPLDVIVGTIVRQEGNTKLLQAIEAWRIDLKKLTFVEVRHKVVCSADGFGGEDDGSDLMDEAKKYAAHGKPGQFD